MLLFTGMVVKGIHIISMVKRTTKLFLCTELYTIRFAVILWCSLLLISCGNSTTAATRQSIFSGSAGQITLPTATATSVIPSANPSAGHDADMVNRALIRTNQLRQLNGCPPLLLNALLDQAAFAHSQDMAVRGYYAHNTPEGIDPGARILAAGYRASDWAENIAIWDYSPEEMINRFYNETPPNDGHRRNILTCHFTEIGIGYFYFPNNPTHGYWTQDFAKP